MISPTRGPERLVRTGQWLIALLFAFFLNQVGSSLIADLPLLSRPPERARFVDQAQVAALETELSSLNRSRAELQEQQQGLAQRQEEARQAYDSEKSSFENWRAARSATEQGAQNPEVIARARSLDARLAEQRQLEAEGRQLAARMTTLQARIAAPRQRLDRLNQEADARLERARRGAELRAFAIRLAFVGPLLALAIWQFQRFRRSDNWPFVWGFLLFGLSAFFFELVPYLPSFGAYIRYGVGAALTYGLGRSLIRWLNAYLQRKQQEMKAPQEQRQGQIRYEKALQAVNRSQCPSCERNLPPRDGQLPNFCMHCGLQVQRDCRRCGHHHLAFFPFCPACGLEVVGHEEDSPQL